MEKSKSQVAHGIIEVPAIEMNGPVTVEVTVYMDVPCKGTARLQFMMPPGQVPTRVEMQDVIDACLDPGTYMAKGIPAGTRMLTKAEFVARIAGSDDIKIPGNPDFVPSIIEIPRGMLIHAIAGAQAETAIAVAPEEHTSFTPGYLEGLTDVQLRALYRGITHV